MSTPRTLFALTLSFALAAEARFGKRSSSDEEASESSASEKQAEASPVHAATAVTETPAVHEATPATYVAPESERHEATAVVETDEAETTSVASDCCSEPSSPRTSYSGPGAVVREGPAPDRWVVPTLGLDTGDGGPQTDYGTATLSLEGRRWGVGGTYSWINAPDLDGRYHLDLVEAHVSYALIAHRVLRVNALAGLNTAFAPDATLLGPRFGLDGRLHVAGGFALEGALAATPIGFGEYEWSAGAAYNFGWLVVRGGYRRTLLDDQNVFRDGGNRDVFKGVYLGVALAL